MAINTDYLKRCILTLESAFQKLNKEKEQITRDIYRAACVKEFELILEQSGKLLKKRLCDWFSSNRQADVLTFKNTFRQALKHGLISTQQCERWLKYRNHRNTTAHDYGEDFAENTLKLISKFIDDARALAQVIERSGDD